MAVRGGFRRHPDDKPEPDRTNVWKGWVADLRKTRLAEPMEHSFIEPAELNDLPSLLVLYAQLHPYDPPLDPTHAALVWSRLIRSEETTVLVARLGDAVVGTCTLTVVPNLTRGGRAYAIIENVVTDAAERRRGIGRALLDAAVRRAWDVGCYKATLATGSKRSETIRFYESAGFVRGKKTHFEASPS